MVESRTATTSDGAGEGAEKGWAGSRLGGLHIDFERRRAHGPGLTPPRLHLRKGPVGGQSHSDNGPAKDH